MPAQVVTPRDNGILRLRGRVTGTKEGGHIIPIMQHCQTRLGISLEGAAFLNRMRVGTRYIPKDPEETPKWFLLGDKLVEFPSCPVARH